MHEKTKACKIPKAVREKVYLRDKCRCVYCGHWCEVENASAHFISRARGGLGIEQNILTLCYICHFNYDNHNEDSSRKEKEEFFRNYLKSKYPNWKEEDLIYDKWKIFKRKGQKV